MRILSLAASISVAVGLVYATAETNNQQARVKRSTLMKRDYATTLQQLLVAMENDRKDGSNAPSAEQSPQSVQAAAAAAAAAAQPQPSVDPVWVVHPEPMPLSSLQEIISTLHVPEQQRKTLPEPSMAAPSLTINDPVTPKQLANEVDVFPELGNEKTEKTAPIDADIEEDDAFDPEEDPDDVDDPPIVDGVAVDREE